MIALKISVNGELLYVIGQEDVSILNSNVVVSRENSERGIDDYIRLNAGGLSQDTDKGHPEHFRYKSQNLHSGDVVKIEVIESDTIDEPVKRYRSDHKIQENPFTDEEWREMRYNDYLQLKEEFEGDDKA
jgi:hypothetical protein